jgi:hypothetical protein
MAFVHPSGKCEVQETYDSGSAELQASLEVALGYLKSQPKQDWRRPNASKLNKERRFRDFYEIRFKANKVQQRPIGYFGPNSEDFTILIWAIEQGNALKPKAWHDIATRHMTDIKAGKANARELRLNKGQAAAPEKENLPERVRTREH